MLKPLLYLLVTTILLSSCSTSRVGTTKQNDIAERNQTKGHPRFLQNISVNLSVEAERPVPDIPKTYMNAFNLKSSFGYEAYFVNSIENSNFLQFKYAILMRVAVEDLTNVRLLHFIDEWYSTRYKYGGSSKKGIDCSAFTLNLLTSVYGINLPRTSKEQFKTTVRLKKAELQEGDLVFFNTRRGVSHVGVYIKNNKFVHASSSSGVMISDLREEYFARRYIGAGRATPFP